MDDDKFDDFCRRAAAYAFAIAIALGLSLLAAAVVGAWMAVLK